MQITFRVSTTKTVLGNKVSGQVSPEKECGSVCSQAEDDDPRQEAFWSVAKVGSGKPATPSPTMTHCVRSYCISQLDSHFLIQFVLAQGEASVSQWLVFRFHLSLSFPAESIHDAYELPCVYAALLLRELCLDSCPLSISLIY